MEIMKIVIFILTEPARVESTSRMKLMRKQMHPRRQSRNVGFHHTLAGSSRIDFLDGWPRGSGRNFWSRPAEFAGPLGGI